MSKKGRDQEGRKKISTEVCFHILVEFSKESGDIGGLCGRDMCGQGQGKEEA